MAKGGVNFFIPNVDPLLGLAYPENLSSIGLMVEAVDTFRGAGAGAVPVLVLVLVPVPVLVGARCDYTENLSLIGFWL